jgi:hypothetical protein
MLYGISLMVAELTPDQQRERLRLEIETAAMRLEWAIAEAKRNPTTPALTRFLEDSREECNVLKTKLAKLEPSGETEEG